MSEQLLQSMLVIFAVFLGFVAFEFKSAIDHVRFEREKRSMVLKRLHALMVDYLSCLRSLKDDMIQKNDISLLVSETTSLTDIETDIRVQLSELHLITRDLRKIQIEVTEDLQHRILQAMDEGRDFVKTDLHLDSSVGIQKNVQNFSIPHMIRSWSEVSEYLTKFIHQIETVLVES